MKWSNWSGGVTCEPVQIETPDTTRGVAALLKDAAARDLGVRVAGSGHSFSRVVETNDVLIAISVAIPHWN